ncbi:MAG: hypothetical protein IKQ30_05585 [Bacteroidales bacterium]|nr:hypothetical protein [Bacteroidales bacterium]
MTFYFVKKYLPPYGDRTVDQMIQAARSGKQNFVEGMADGVTSFEMQIKLLNVGNTRLPTNGISAAMAKAFGATIPMRNGLPKQCGNEIVGNPSLLLWK